METAALSKLFLLGLLDGAAARQKVLADIVERIEQDGSVLEALGSELDGAEIPAEHLQIFRYQRGALAYGIEAHRDAVHFFAQLRDAE